MEIRKMAEADLPEVCEIEKENFSEPWTEEDFRNAVKDKNNIYLTAVINERIAGYCGCWGIAGEGDIFNVAVKKEFRRQSIAFLLLGELKKEAAARGITSLTLEVRISNEPAIALYQKLGFVHSGIRKDFYSKPREDAVIMWLNAIQ